MIEKRILFFISFAIFQLFFIPSSQTQENWAHGPIEIGNQFPLAIFHNSLSPESPEVAKKGKSIFRTSFNLSNTFTLGGDNYLIDTESRVWNLSLRYGYADNLEFRLDLPIIWLGAGFTDPAIDRWHEIFNLPNGQRDLIPENEFHLLGANNDSSSFNLKSPRYTLGDISIAAKYLITKGDSSFPSFAIKNTLRVPTASKSAYNQNSIDYGLDLLASKRFNDFYIYSGLNYSYFSDNNSSNIRFKKNHFGVFLNTELRLNSQLSFHLGYIWLSNLIESIKGFPRYSMYLDMGITYEINNALGIEVLLRENPAPRYGTTDISTMLALVWRR